MVLNEEVVKWKEKGDCKEGRINDPNLCCSFPPGATPARSHLRALEQQGLGPAGCRLLGAMVSPAFGSLTSFVSRVGWQFVSLDPLQY